MSASLFSALTEISLDSLQSEDVTVYVYVLVSDGEIVYVGKTVNLQQRLCFHLNGDDGHEPKQFDRAFYIPVAASESAAYEGALIRRFNPALCNGSPSDETRDREILSKFGLEPDPANRDAFVAKRRALFIRAFREKRLREQGAA